jgi:sphingolipid delta-4 desaturase
MIICVALVTLGLGICYLVKVKINMIKDASWPVYLLTAYIVGGTINHSLHVLIHDLTHWAGHKNLYVNKFFGILCNIPMGIPSAISFGKYHNDHHNYLGE